MVPDRIGREFLRSYPGHASFAGQARRDVRDFAAQSGCSAADVDDISLAVGEVLGLALEGAVRAGMGIRIRAQCFADRFEIDVQSEGARFGARRPMRDAAFDPLAPRGFSMQIVRKVMNQLTIADGGTRIHLVKRRSRS